jgi:hypothetical protein
MASVANQALQYRFQLELRQHLPYLTQVKVGILNCSRFLVIYFVYAAYGQWVHVWVGNPE